jgi:hypothetical protein
VGRFRASQPPVISASSSAAAANSERVVAQHQQEQESVFQCSVSQRRWRQLSNASNKRACSAAATRLDDGSEPTGQSVAEHHATDTTTPLEGT